MTGRSRLVNRGVLLLVQIGIVLAASTASHAEESWDAVYLGGAKIGFVHTFVEKLKDKGRDFLRVRIDMELNLKRGNDIASPSFTYGTIETLDGQVLKLDTLYLRQRGQQRPPSAWQRDPRQDDADLGRGRRAPAVDDSLER